MTQRRPITRGFWSVPFIGTLVAITIAIIYFLATQSIPIIHDAAGYHRIGRQIWTQGLFSKWELSEMRTWGYPTLLGGLLKLAAAVHLSERVLVFAVQLAAYIASAFALRWAIGRARVPAWAATAAFCAVLLHPFALIYPSFMLTESLSQSLGTAVLACAIALMADARRQVAIAAVGGLLSGMMMAVRPSSAFIVPTLLLALAGAWFVRRPGRRAMLGMATAALLCLSAPLMPQLRNNIVYYQKPTVLVAAPFAQGQQYIGILWIKYATSIEPNRDPQIKYLNPLAVDEPMAATNPMGWYLRHPGRGLVTFALHAFNLLDQDLPVPYNTTLVPGYYPFVSIANLAVVALGLTGIGAMAASWRRRTPVERWTAAIAVGTLVCHLGLHSLFSVEARYGVAALIILYAFAAISLGWLIRTASARARLLVGIWVIAFCIGGSLLSSWVRWQSPAIRAEIEAAARP